MPINKYDIYIYESTAYIYICCKRPHVQKYVNTRKNYH